MDPQPDLAPRLRATLADDLRTAQRERDATRVQVLRALLGAIDNSGAVSADQSYDASLPGLGQTERERRGQDAAALRQLFLGERQEREEAVNMYRGLGQDGEADRLEAEIAVISGYLRDPILIDGDAAEP